MSEVPRDGITLAVEGEKPVVICGECGHRNIVDVGMAVCETRLSAIEIAIGHFGEVLEKLISGVNQIGAQNNEMASVVTDFGQKFGNANPMELLKGVFRGSK